MGTPAIRVEGVGKRYVLGATHGGGSLMTERIQDALLAPFRRARPKHAHSHLKAAQDRQEELWALRNVSLEVEQGEIVGLIGPNGAGKSTLLKLLSAITPPSEGRIELWGRTATLLEVGTGFHPELTGRENVFINGAILGMRRREIEERFDEIVEFSGVERFIDTPVKRYSSGMYVRLAFSVAAHLDPEILMVDEVLAVGDAEFQRKCLGKMDEASDLGRTVVFVSHNMQAVQEICTRACVIDHGGIVAEGSPAQAVAEYLSMGGTKQTGAVALIPPDATRDAGTRQAILRRVTMTDDEGRQINSLLLGQRFRVALLIDAKGELDAVIEVGISTSDGRRIATTHNLDREGAPQRLREGFNEVELELGMTLLPGEYVLDVGIGHHPSGINADYVWRAFRFNSVNEPVEGETRWPAGEVRGYVRPESHWSEVRLVSDPTANLISADVGTGQSAD